MVFLRPSLISARILGSILILTYLDFQTRFSEELQARCIKVAIDNFSLSEEFSGKIL